MLGFNRKLDSGEIFANFQYISGNIARFYTLGGIEMNPIVKGEKYNFP